VEQVEVARDLEIVAEPSLPTGAKGFVRPGISSGIGFSKLIKLAKIGLGI
jgi:hypothetical protein